MAPSFLDIGFSTFTLGDVPFSSLIRIFKQVKASKVATTISSRHFMGLSSIHSSEVPLVLNTTTGSITPQFHVVFNDSFSTVPSLQRENDPPSFWNDLCLENTVYIITDVTPENGLHLVDDWLTDSERTEKLRQIQRRENIRTRMTGRTSVPIPPQIISEPSTDSILISDPPLPALISLRSVASTNPTSVQIPSPPEPILIAVPETPQAVPTRRSNRSTKGQFTSTRFFDEVFLTPLANVAKSDENTRQLAYLASLCTCYDTGLENKTDPRMYFAKNRKDDPDMPTFHQAADGPNADDYIFVSTPMSHRRYISFLVVSS
jgi:hypothetical protein